MKAPPKNNASVSVEVLSPSLSLDRIEEGCTHKRARGSDAGVVFFASPIDRSIDRRISVSVSVASSFRARRSFFFRREAAPPAATGGRGGRRAGGARPAHQGRIRGRRRATEGAPKGPLRNKKKRRRGARVRSGGRAAAARRATGVRISNAGARRAGSGGTKGALRRRRGGDWRERGVRRGGGGDRVSTDGRPTRARGRARGACRRACRENGRFLAGESAAPHAAVVTPRGPTRSPH